ncbi:MAG TPA: 1-deoxy-D-xylulose-5-phosphate reductoisomerase [Bacteroidota bacterium]|nr:1-deoxy-D-xylulose-5-phosphate reductoisomerase [Bacteroidota bacterium]
MGERQKNIAILGSSGSIGKNSLEVIANFPSQFKVSYLTVNKNVDELCDQVKRFRPKGVVVLDPDSAAACKKRVNGTTEVLAGERGLEEVVQRDDVDVVISSLVGFAGLKPTIKAIQAKKKIALANKETLVVAGQIIMRLVKEHGVTLIPVDSEHSAIFQCLVGESGRAIGKVILTASGGPFLNASKDELTRVTVAQALKHPNWKMGNKITIDSATLMNKGLEVIEAHWLFGVPPEKIEVVIHPQSIIHSMVEFVDGSVKAQLGVPDMKIPIQYALTFPERATSNFVRVDFPRLKELTFFTPDLERFRCLGLAFDALKQGGTMPAALNAANEVAVDRFLSGTISFSQIPEIISRTMKDHTSTSNPSLEDIIGADASARKFASGICR